MNAVAIQNCSLKLQSVMPSTAVSRASVTSTTLTSEQLHVHRLRQRSGSVAASALAGVAVKSAKVGVGTVGVHERDRKSTMWRACNVDHVGGSDGAIVVI